MTNKTSERLLELLDAYVAEYYPADEQLECRVTVSELMQDLADTIGAAHDQKVAGG